MINIPNTDSNIWNFPNKTVEIISEIVRSGSVEINLDQEGPDCNTLGLYDLLDEIVEKFNVDPANITIRTCNQLEAHPRYRIKILPVLYVEECNEFIDNHDFPDKTFDSDFKTFGLFLGRLNWIRLALLGKIQTSYEAQTLYTCHYDRDIDFHIPNIGLEGMIRNGLDWDTVAQGVKTLEESPVRLGPMPKYPIISPAHMEISKVYHKFFVEIVAETYFTGRTFYPTEKIWRPILMRTPFIVQGPQNYLSNLRKLGFQTFNKWWDEGFGEDPFDYQLNGIYQVIDTLSSYTTEQLESMYKEMQTVLDNNYECLRNLTKEEISKVFYNE